MASTKTKTTQAPAESAEVPEAADWREEGDRLAALYGLTPKVETAIAAAVAEGADDRARACGAASPGRPGGSSGTSSGATGGGAGAHPR